ncbi:MAG TPA: ATP-binding protein [Cyanobacteria bacterium UBA12227]|nr:ATP-binding protein [Cyanobacteria bacterium UBA12227]HAX87221.1 ATP-binding protein [Cyanobacteria bacterium UBA11370]
MKVKRLKINSFRGIGNLILEFDETDPTVLIGINGAGKSSILDCLAVLLSHFVAEIQDSTGTGRFSNDPYITEKQKITRRFFRQEDIANGAPKTHNEITISLQQQDVSWFLSLSKIKERPKGADVRELEGICFRIKSQLQDNPEFNLPLPVYYPVNREFCDDIPQKAPKQYWSKRVEVFDQALMGARISFNSFFEWFKELEDIENELRLDNSEHRDRQLEAVRQAIASLLPGFSNLRVRRSPLRMTVMKQNQELIIDQLSDGEKGLLAMIADLARRLAIANPSLTDPLQGRGVVLIDEIDLHLHPKWQCRIIGDLKRTFPNCQFIVTTHSPQVIAEVKCENIYHLEVTSEGVIARHPNQSFGGDTNRIMEDLMGVNTSSEDVCKS